MKIYFLRHGETELNVLRKYYGGTDVSLTEHGRLQMREVARDIQGLEITRVIVSSLKRTTESAEIIMKKNNLKSLKKESCSFFNERDFGAWETLDANEVEATFPSDWRAFIEDPFSVTPSGGETYLAFQRRVLDGFEQLLKASVDTDHILFIGHGGVIRELVANFFEPDKSYWDIVINNGQLYEYEVKKICECRVFGYKM